MLIGIGRLALGRLPQRHGCTRQGALPLGNEVILLVEDETAVRELAARTLRQLGYSVLEAANGEEALRLAKASSTLPQLLLTDVIMPNMTGSQLAEQIKAMRPGIKVVFMSGYTGAMIGDQIGDAMMVQKPFTPSSLERKIREALDTPLAARQAS